jgi:hypothetical protein
MANFDIIFKDSILPNELTSKIETDLHRNEITIYVLEYQKIISNFTMDKSTAIKFAKTLRTEINKITESEVYNG